MSHSEESHSNEIQYAQNVSNIWMNSILPHIAHDLCNVLDSMSSNLYAIKRKTSLKQVDSIEQDLQKIKTCLKYLEMPLEKTRHKNTSIDMAELVQDITSLLAPFQQAKMLINIDCPVLTCSKTDLQMIVWNLLQNSFESAVGSPVKIQITCFKKENALVFEIQDDGKGIDQAHLSHVCDFGFTTKEGVHQGLGLYYIHQIVHAKYKGSLQIQSKVGAGTKVSVTLFNVFA